MGAVSIRVPSVATAFTNIDTWQNLMQSYHRAKAAAEQADAAYDTGVVADGGIEAEFSPNTTALGELADQLAHEEYQARFRLVQTPAPDIAAVLWKMNALFREGENGPDDPYISAWDRKYTDAVRADLERLSEVRS